MKKTLVLAISLLTAFWGAVWAVDGEASPSKVIENAVDKAEDVANVLEGVVLKHG